MFKLKSKIVSLSLLSFISISLFSNYKGSNSNFTSTDISEVKQNTNNLLIKNRYADDLSNYKNEELSKEEMDRIVDGYNAYTNNNRLYLPRKTGKYIYQNDPRFDWSYEEFQRYLKKWIKQNPYLEIDKWSWDYKYYDGLNVEDIYNYRGDIVPQYYTKTRHRCKRVIEKTVNRTETKVRYKHYMRGSKWYNCFIFYCVENDSKAPENKPNYHEYRLERIVRTKNIPEKIKVTEYSDFGEWSRPFNMPPRRWGEPKWEYDLSEKQYMLKISEFLKWTFEYTERNELKFRDVPLKYKISSNDSIGIHLKMWPGVSNLNDKYNPLCIPSYSTSNDRIDCFYFDCDKLVNELRIELINILSSEIFSEINDNWVHQTLLYLATKDTKYITPKYAFDTFKYLIKNFGGLVVKFIRTKITSKSPSIYSLIIAAIKTGIKVIKDLVNEFKDLKYLFEISYELSKYDDEYFNKYKYFFVGVDEKAGFKFNFFDERDNPYDDHNFVSLQYSDNEFINNVDLSRNNYFKNIFGFPRKINSLETLARNISSIKNKETYILGDYNYKFSDFNI